MSDPACKKNRGHPRPRGAKALYVHVPFCRSKCRYCDFYSIRLDRPTGRDYVRAVLAELTARGDCLRLPLASVFVGGGSPTCLGPELLGELLSAIGPLIGKGTEFTVECNPDTVDRTTAESLAGAGVSRASVGVQSFHDDELKMLGRTHNHLQARRAMATLQAAGIAHLSADLMYGLPGQTLDTWGESLGRTLACGIEHLSCYALSFEPGTPLHRDLARGTLRQMDEACQSDCYQAAIAAATRAGMEHYEISNFARPGRSCRQNLTYWRNEPYLGVGPAAASYIAGRRRTNHRDLAAYLSAMRNGQTPPNDSEQLTGRAAMAETIMLALRLITGVDRQAFQRRFGHDPAEAFSKTIRRYAELGALAVTPSHVRLTGPFLFVADTIMADILAEA